MTLNVRTVLSLLLIAAPLLFYACKKDKKCSAGIGGSVTLILEPEHHGKPIYSQPNYPDTAYIAFDAAEFPGEDPADYDLVVVGQTGTKQVSISGLQCGKYFVFMTGLDTSIVERVKGGIPYEFSQTEGVISLKIPVTED